MSRAVTIFDLYGESPNNPNLANYVNTVRRLKGLKDQKVVFIHETVSPIRGRAVKFKRTLARLIPEEAAIEDTTGAKYFFNGEHGWFVRENAKPLQSRVVFPQ